MKSFTYITEEAKSDRGLCNVDTVKFHAWNPNGLAARRRQAYDRLFELVDSGKAKSGALIAYDCDFYMEQMRSYVNRKRLGTTRTQVWKELFEKAVEKLERFVEENK